MTFIMSTPTKHSTAASDHAPLHFPTQRSNEQVFLLVRRHWIKIASAIVRLVVSVLLPPMFLAILFYATSLRVSMNSLPYILLILGLNLYYLFSLLAYFHSFIDYHLDIWVVTDQRIISIEQEGLFRRVISELNIMNVQDVTSEVDGKVETFFNFGDVHIQTAGERERFVFEDVPHPAEVAKIVLQVHEAAVKEEEREMMQMGHALPPQ